MASKLIIGFIMTVCISSVLGQRPEVVTGPGCTTAASITKRVGSDYLDSQGRTNSIFDITVTNVGTCNAYDIGVQFGLPTGAEIVQRWNVQIVPRAETITGFGDYLAVGQSFGGAGIIVAFADSSSQNVVINVYGTNCPASCVNSGSSSSADSSSSESGCPATVNTVFRTSYNSGNTVNCIFDIDVTNTASSTLETVQITYAIENRTVTGTWNLVNACCTQIESVVSYNVNLYSLQVGSTFSGAGFIQTLPEGSTCTPPTAQVFNPNTGLICGLAPQ
eukprot:TRINITY_DN353_c0_g1_i2.p1 TRINITY_DN353_c0_g1~~TRINITY_DN353_c0_g1_i2.p1  ORF type:complete len:277 (-),score=59.47 TRINITY_DN353_c0_g1_i2:83-913(-)